MKTITLDLETTGVPAKGFSYEDNYNLFPYILSIAWKINDQPTVEFILNQDGRLISPEITAINGITQEMVDNSLHTFESIIVKLLDEGPCDLIVGHNIYFDTSIIKANILRFIQLEKLNKNSFDIATDFLHKNRRIDTMRAGQRLCGKWPKLTELHMKLFQEEFEAHSSGNDVDATYRCFKELVSMNLIVLPKPIIIGIDMASKEPTVLVQKVEEEI